MWDLIENPQTSKWAQMISIISIFFIIVSTVTLTLNTMPELQQKQTSLIFKTNFSEPQYHEYHVDNPVFETIESICIAWFTLEYLLRFLSSPNKVEFIKGLLNLIDLISILPFFVSLVFSSLAFASQQYENINNARRILTLFRVLRILRIFKLARHSTGLKSLGYTLKRSNKELGLLMMFLSIAVLLFSSLAYFAEKEEPATRFNSIPNTFWYESQDGDYLFF